MGEIYDSLAEMEEPDSVARLDFASKNPIDPNKSARILNMQAKTGLPVDLIENNLDLVEREAANVDFEPDKFLKESPVTASWVAEHPNHWALVKDEWESMGRAEWLWKAFSAAKAEGWDEVELNRIWNRRKEGRATEQDVARGEELEKRIGGHDFGAGAAGLFITDMAKQLPQMISGMKRGAELGMASAVGTGTIGLVAGGPPGAAAAFGIGGTAGFASGVALHAYEQESGGDYRQLIQEGVDPEIARVSATVSGFINALLEATGTMAITSQIPGVRQLRGALVRDSMKSLLKNPTFLKAMGRFAKGTGIGVGGEVVTEITQEAVSMLVSEVAKNADPQSFAPLTRDQFTDALKEIAAVTFRATLIPGAAGPTVQVAIDTNRVRRARTNRRIFELLGEEDSEQTLRDKLPAKKREWVERIREKGLVKAINIPVDRFDTYFQSQDIDPAEMAEELTGSPDAYLEAKAAGTDLEIKNEDFAEKLLNSEHYEGLIDDLRLHPDDMTAREAKEWVETGDELVKTLAEQLDSEEQVQTGDQAVFDDVMGQLLAANIERGAAEQNATLMSSVFTTLGERTGIDPLELYQRYGLSISGRQLPEVLRNLADVDINLDPLLDRLRTGDIPSQQDIFGDSLIDFVKIHGGLKEDSELTDRDVPKLVRGLVKKDGLTIDEAAELASEAGYIDEHDVTQFMAAFDAELAGDFVAPSAIPNAELQELAASLDELQGFLNEQNIDLSEIDNAAVKALLFPEGTTFEQTVFHGSPHIFDEFSAEAIGTGEGVQAFGHGLYFAENKGVAESYARFIKPNDEILAISAKLNKLSAAMDPYRMAEYGKFKDPRGDELFAEYEQLLTDRQDSIDKQGNIYQAEIPDEIVAEMLDRDAPIDQQPENVKKAIADLQDEYGTESVGVIDQEGIFRRTGFADANRDGAEFYNALSDVLGSDVAASEELEKRGVPGIKFFDQRSRAGVAGGGGFLAPLADAVKGKDTRTRNIVLFDPSNIEQVKRDGETVFEKGKTLFQDKAKASITFDEATRQVAINLTKASDLSSFLHESGHFYLEVLGDLAEAENAPEQIVQDYAVILKNLGVENRQGIGEEQHETLARLFETYLMEGKAPSVELQAAFARFKAWLLNIYKRLAALNVDLNDEMRGVFDRLVATDEAISTAEESQNYVALFSTPETAGMSPEVFAAYRKAVERARVESEETLGRKLLDVKRREQLKWWQTEREKVLTDVTAEIHGMREYRALAYLQKGKAPDGTELDIEHQKLSKDILVARYGAEFLKRLPRPYVYSVKGGLDPDEVALVFGFQSGQELVQELAEVKNRPMDPLIKAETEARMKERYPDPMLDGSMADEAQNAVHNDKRAELLAAELRMIRQLQRRDRPAVRAAEQTRQREEREARETLPGRDELKLIRMAAERMIGPRAPRDIKPHVFRSAESKAARLTRKALAKGDYQAAAFQKRRQILNHELFRAAEIAQTEAEKIREYFLTFRRKSVRTKIGKAQDGGLEKIEAILAEIDLHRISGKQIDRNAAKAEIRQAIEDGKLVATPDTAALFNGPPMPNWRQLSIDSLRGVRDIVKQIETQAKAESEMVVNGEKLEIAAVAGEIGQSILDAGKTVDVGIGQETKAEHRKRSAKEMLAAWLNSPAIARLLDGEDFGAFTKYVIVPIRRAYAERLIPGQHKAREDMAAIYVKHYENKELASFQQRTFFPVLGANLSKSDILSLALNWGNESNRKAVLNGVMNGEAAFTQAGVAEALNTLDARDWAFVQDTWDYLNSYWPELAAAEKRRRGISPEKIEAMPFTVDTSDGQRVNLRGGYMPLAYNKLISERTKELDVQDYFDKMGNGIYVSANTRAGSTFERVGSGGQVVQLGLGLVDKHLREIVRDIAIGDEVNFVKKILNHKSVKGAMKETGNTPALGVLNLWLQDSAVGELPSDGSVEAALAYVRTGFVKSKLAWNLMVTFLQWTGITQTWVVVGNTAMSHGIGKYITNPRAMHKHIMETSAFLNTRYKNNAWDKDVMDTQAHLMAGFGKLPPGVSTTWRQISATFFIPIARAQMVVDEATWLAAYWKGKNVKELEGQDIISYADAVVEASQTSGFFSDRSGIERGTVGWKKTRQSQWIRIWTTLISYMLRKGGLGYEAVQQFRSKPKTIASSVKLASDLFVLFVIESMTTAALYGRWPDDDDDEAFAWWLAKETAESVAAGIPLVREVSSAMFSSGNTPIGGLTTDIYDLSQQLGQWELDDTLLKELNNVGGTLFHYPSSQLNRALESAWAEGVEGEDVPFYEYLTGKRYRE